MSLLNWNSSLEVGVAKIDHEHQQLVRMLNELHEAMSKGRGNEVLGQLLGKLVQYTVSHFAMEERLMRQHTYPQASKHVQEHEHLKGSVRQLQSDLAGGRKMLTLEAMRFLQQWLSKHILGSDLELASFLNARGVQ